MKKLVWIALALIILNIGLTVWQKWTTPRVAFVRSNELVYGYFGMKEAYTKLEEFKRAQNGPDTLNAELQRSIQKAREMQRLGRLDSLAAMEYLIGQQQAMLRKQQNDVAAAVQNEEKELLQGVLAQVNSFVEEYGKEHEYDVILGTTDAGSLMYGTKALDITDELLQALNIKHQGS